MNNENSNEMIIDPHSILVARFDKHQVTAMDLMQMNNIKAANQEKEIPQKSPIRTSLSP
jgi:hypothetical protein